MADSNEHAPSTDSTVDEPQIATLDDLNFISTTTSGGASTSINSDDFVEVATVGSSSFEPMAPVVAPSAASGVFSSMGVGWLLEEAEEDDTDIQGTLLYVCDPRARDVLVLMCAPSPSTTSTTSAARNWISTWPISCTKFDVSCCQSRSIEPCCYHLLTFGARWRSYYSTACYSCGVRYDPCTLGSRRCCRASGAMSPWSSRPIRCL